MQVISSLKSLLSDSAALRVVEEKLAVSDPVGALGASSVLLGAHDLRQHVLHCVVSVLELLASVLPS